jgi:hypothetical protein
VWLFDIVRRGDGQRFMREPRSRTPEPPYREEGAPLSGIPDIGTYDARPSRRMGGHRSDLMSSTPRIATQRAQAAQACMRRAAALIMAILAGVLAKRSHWMNPGRGSEREGRMAPRRATTMLRIAAVGLALIVVGLPQPDGARAQDIAGMEDCTKTPGLDKRTGCFQSNVNFLHQLVTKNALEARQRLNAANNEIVALKAALASLQTTVEQLQAAQKAANEKKPPAK